MSQIDTIHKSEFPRCHIHNHSEGSSNGTCSGTQPFVMEEISSVLSHGSGATGTHTSYIAYVT